MKIRRLKYELRSNASSYHTKVADILRSSTLLRAYRSYNEYPVNKINPDWKDGRAKIDWVILDLRLAIEVHGEFHDTPSTIGGCSKKEAVLKMQERQRADAAKEAAIRAVGWLYVAVWYYEDITEELIWKKIQQEQGKK